MEEKEETSNKVPHLASEPKLDVPQETPKKAEQPKEESTPSTETESPPFKVAIDLTASSSEIMKKPEISLRSSESAPPPVEKTPAVP